VPKYGTFAEIGAGQEVAREFFQAGGASGTIAKSISAYDMVFSDAIYGKAPRYVSRERLTLMLGDDGPHPRRGRHQAQGTFRPCRQTQPRCVSQRLVLLLLILRGQTDHIDLSQIKPIQVQPAPWTAEASDVFFIAGDPCIRKIFSTMPRARSPELPLQNGASWADNRKPERRTAACAKIHLASPLVALLQLRPNGLCERQQIVKVGTDYRVENIQVQFAVLMNRKVAKTHHFFKPVPQLRRDDALTHQSRERISSFIRNTEASPSNRHIRKIDSGIAGTDDVEDRCILQVVVGPHAGTRGGICLTRTGHTTLQRGNLLHADVGHEP
jgi:hypothetical protein